MVIFKLHILFLAVNNKFSLHILSLMTEKGGVLEAPLYIIIKNKKILFFLQIWLTMFVHYDTIREHAK